MKLARTSFLTLLLLLCTLFESCKNNTPSDVISPDTMEHLIYDYTLAHSLATVSADSVNYNKQLFTDAVFKKYGVTKEEFDLSMIYYTRHSKQLYNIYKNVYAQFSDALGEHSTLQNTTNGIAYDSITLWSGNDFNILSPETSRLLNFDVDPKKIKLKSGDQLCMTAHLDWLSKWAEHITMYVLFITFANDSVDTQTRTFYSTGEQQLNIPIDTTRIKHISGFIYQRSSPTETPHILFAYHPRLLRIRQSEIPKHKETTDKTNNDTLSTDRP